jgi:hypothetical protein
VDLDHEALRLHLLPSPAEPIRFSAGAAHVVLAGGQSHEFSVSSSR